MKKKNWLSLLAGLLLVAGVDVRADLLESGWAAYNKGSYEEAYDLFSKAFRTDPGNVNINFALGEAAFQKKKYSHAVFAYDRVLMAEPGHQKARYGKARTLMALGQTNEARAEYATLLKSELDPAVRESAEAAMATIDHQPRELKLKGELSIAMFYDDNINFGPTDSSYIFGANSRDETWGIEVGAGVSAEYDVGQKDGWVALGFASVLNSWLDSDSAQESRTTKLRAGAKKLGQRNLYEMAGRIEMITYGHDRLVNIYAVDGAWLHAKTRDDYLITRASIEHRDYDDAVDPNNDRDSIYLKAGETWKHFFANRKNNVELGAELFMEKAGLDSNSNRGLRLCIDGERELLGGIIAYAGGRYRLTNYEEPSAGASEREDNRFDFILGAKRRIAKNCTLDLRHQYIRNDSNIGISDYTRHRTSLTATFEF
jgi:tetratricopeptide (TPR) repeat protein